MGPGGQPWDVTWSPTKAGGGAGGILSGAMSGASAGSALGPWGALGGAIVGGFLGSRKKELSQAEQLANNYDALQNTRLKNTGAWAAQNYAGSLSDYTGALQGAYSDFLAGKGPGSQFGAPQLSELSGFARRAENFQPTEAREALQRTLGREKAIGTMQDPIAARLYGELGTQRRGFEANPFMTASQKARVGGEAERGVARNVAEQGVTQLQGLYGQEQGYVNTITNALVQALQIAGSGYASAAQIGASLSNLYMQNQQAFLQAMSQLPSQYRDYLTSMMPNPAQYGAAQQGGKGTDWAGLLSQGADIYNKFKGRGGPGSGGYGPAGAPPTGTGGSYG